MPLWSQHEPTGRTFSDDRFFTVLFRIEENLVVVEYKVLARHKSFNLLVRLAVVLPLTLAQLYAQLSSFRRVPVTINFLFVLVQTDKLFTVAINRILSVVLFKLQKIAFFRTRQPKLSPSAGVGLESEYLIINIVELIGAPLVGFVN